MLAHFFDNYFFRSSSRTEVSPAAKRRRRVKQEVFTAELLESQEEVEPKQEVEVDYYHSPSESQSSSVSVYH